MVQVTKQAKRNYSIDGVGPASKAIETRHARSAAVQTLRELINSSWQVTEEGMNLTITMNVYVTGMPGGVRQAVATGEAREGWSK